MNKQGPLVTKAAASMAALRPTERLFIEKTLAQIYPRLRYTGLPLLKQLAGPLIPDFLVASTSPDTRRIVEIGCGDGLFSNVLSLLFPSVEIVGIDPNPDKIAFARTTISFRQNLKFICGHAGAMMDIPCDRIIYNDCLSSLKSPAVFKKLILKTSPWLVEEGDFLVKESPLKLMINPAFLESAPLYSALESDGPARLPRLLLQEIGCLNPRMFESPGLPGLPSSVFYQGKPIFAPLPDPVLMEAPRCRKAASKRKPFHAAERSPEPDSPGSQGSMPDLPPDVLDFLFKEEQARQTQQKSRWEFV